MAEVAKLLPLTGTIIPDDILIDILLKLPVRSLLFFRSVSKRWLNLIQNPNFIKLHSSRPNDDHLNPLLIVRNIEEVHGIDKIKIVFTLLYDDDSRAYENDIPLDLVSPFYGWRFFNTVLLLGPCNGLFCRIDLAEISVFNPATRRCRKISPPSSSQSYVDSYVVTCIGFGFDHVSNDYKVVRFDQTIYFDYNNYDNNGEDNISRSDVNVEIYSSSTNSWRQVECVEPTGGIIIQPHTYSVFISGGFHWLNDSINDQSILVFDLKKESLKRWKLPDSSNVELLDLLILNDSLSLIVRTNNSTNSEYDTFEVWAMKEYEVYESWRRLYKIPAGNFDRPLCFGKDGEFLLQKNDGQLMSYNLNNMAVKEFQVHGIPESMSALRYKETLASLK